MESIDIEMLRKFNDAWNKTFEVGTISTLTPPVIQARTDKIIVQDMKRSKLIIHNSIPQPEAYGKVISFGLDVKDIQLDDILVFHKNGGMHMIIEGKLFRCLMENEVYGIVKSEEIVQSLTPCE